MRLVSMPFTITLRETGPSSACGKEGHIIYHPDHLEWDGLGMHAWRHLFPRLLFQEHHPMATRWAIYRTQTHAGGGERAAVDSSATVISNLSPYVTKTGVRCTPLSAGRTTPQTACSCWRSGVPAAGAIAKLFVPVTSTSQSLQRTSFVKRGKIMPGPTNLESFQALLWVYVLSVVWRMRWNWSHSDL